MSTDWPYAQIAHEMSIHGGPQKFIALTKRIGFCEGVVTCLLIGATHYLFERFVYTPLRDKQLKADRLLAEKDEDNNWEKNDFKRIIHNEDDIEAVRSFLEEYDIESATDLDELRARLEELEGVCSETKHVYEDELEEPKAPQYNFEDEMFSYLAIRDSFDEDDPLVRCATHHPMYGSFRRRYLDYSPEAAEQDVIRAFVRMMAPLEEEAEDGYQS